MVRAKIEATKSVFKKRLGPQMPLPIPLSLVTAPLLTCQETDVYSPEKLNRKSPFSMQQSIVVSIDFYMKHRKANICILNGVIMIILILTLVPLLTEMLSRQKNGNYLSVKIVYRR